MNPLEANRTRTSKYVRNLGACYCSNIVYQVQYDIAIHFKSNCAKLPLHRLAVVVLPMLSVDGFFPANPMGESATAMTKIKGAVLSDSKRQPERLKVRHQLFFFPVSMQPTKG